MIFCQFKTIEEELLLKRRIQSCKLSVIVILIALSALLLWDRASLTFAAETDQRLIYWRGEIRKVLLEYIDSVTTPNRLISFPQKIALPSLTWTAPS
jgi:hypothetical protein